MTATEPEVVHYAVIRLADNEWGNTLMEEVAREFFRDHPELDPLEVEVIEHAGWHLTFLRDLTIADTANDMACLDGRAKAHNRKYRHAERQWVAGIPERPHAYCKQCCRDDEIVGGGLCRRCKLVEFMPR
jgi:hypothetical protein